MSFMSFTDAVPVSGPQTKPLNVLITGASRGLGYGLVQQYAAAHADNQVFAGVRSVSSVSSAALVSFSMDHPNVHVLELDVNDEASVVKSVSSVVSEYQVGHIDVLINNAGIMQSEHDALKTSSDDMISTYRTNVVGPLLVVQSYLSLLQASDEAKVINVSSFLGSNYVLNNGSPLLPTSYGASKAALNYLNNLLSHAFPDILFLSISPGWVDTDMGGSTGAKPPTTINDSVQAIRYYTAEKNVHKNQGEFIDAMSGQIIPY